MAYLRRCKTREVDELESSSYVYFDGTEMYFDGMGSMPTMDFAELVYQGIKPVIDADNDVAKERIKERLKWHYRLVECAHCDSVILRGKLPGHYANHHRDRAYDPVLYLDEDG